MKSDELGQIHQTDGIGVPVQGSSLPIEDTRQGVHWHGFEGFNQTRQILGISN